MLGFAELVGLSAAMGLSIYLSLPVVLYKATDSRSIALLNAAAIGILVFVLADVFSDVAASIYSNPANPYVANLPDVLYFVAGVAGTYLVLFAVEHRSRTSALTPTGTAVVVAGAIGFQNLTEGLVLGAAWAAGSLGLSSVVFLGFFLQNITEGFPITSPLLARDDRRLGAVALIFLLGGLPTVVGGVSGYFYNSTTIDVVFDALAIGAILYSLLAMMRIVLRPAPPPAPTYARQRLLYLGLVAGFLAGFLVNAV